MQHPLEKLQRMEYPGRVIIMGRSPKGDDVIMYAITGRSPSSQARRLKHDPVGKQLLVTPTDEELLKTGQPELLIYTALFYDNGIIVGNGKQTDGIRKAFSLDKEPVEVLLHGQRDWHYEHDAPNYTPRISGCITQKGAALSIIKHADNDTDIRQFFTVPHISGAGFMLTTYTGVNAKILPSFQGEPQQVQIPWNNPQECALALYDTLKPAEGNPDFRVAAASLYRGNSGDCSFYCINRNEGK